MLSDCCLPVWPLFVYSLLSTMSFCQLGESSHLSPKLGDAKDIDLSDLTKNDLSKILDEIINRRQTHSKCVDQFENEKELIIRTSDSMKNGALFISAPPPADSAEKCKAQCCQAKSKDGSRHCDLAVFQEIDDRPDDSQPKCFLFSCTNKKGEAVCKTSRNTDYSVYRMNIALEEDELRDVASSNPTTTTPKTTPTRMVSTTTTTVRATMTTKTTTMLPMTTSPTITMSTTKSATSSTPVVSSCAGTCKRLDWECDNGCCVSIKQVCDGHIDCSDSSDELMCKGLQSENEVALEAMLDEEGEKPPTTTLLEVGTESVKDDAPAKEVAHANTENAQFEVEAVGERTSAQRGAVLPLALGLSVTACVLVMVICRLRIMKKKLHRRGKPLTMEESDYLINGMYL